MTKRFDISPSLVDVRVLNFPALIPDINLDWLAYGIAIDSLPMILANAATLTLAGTILVLKLRYG